MHEPLNLLTFHGAQPDDPRVLEWFADHKNEIGDLAARWFGVIRGCGDDVLELLHDGYPIACLGAYPFAHVAAYKAHANIAFYLGAYLPDPNGLLEGSGKRMRHVKVKPGIPADTEAITTLIHAAYADMHARIN
ncbi:MAG: DUF1801 domain-containing protein [Pseudomonadota bacterium]